MPGEFADHSREAVALGSDCQALSMSHGPSELLANGDDSFTRAKPAIMLDGFIKAIERIERVIDLETEMLKQHKPVVLHDFNHNKSHGLLELSRTMDAVRALDHGAVECGAKAALARLRVKLESNLAILEMHLNAVREIAEIIARSIQDHESDGTYTEGINSKGNGR